MHWYSVECIGSKSKIRFKWPLKQPELQTIPLDTTHVFNRLARKQRALSCQQIDGIKANATAFDMAQTFSVQQELTDRKQPFDEIFPQEVIYREERLPEDLSTGV